MNPGARPSISVPQVMITNWPRIGSRRGNPGEGPGGIGLAIVVNRCARSTGRSFMENKCGEGCVHEQDCLNCPFQMIVMNLPPTRQSGITKPCY